MKSMALLTAQLQHTAGFDLVMRGYLSSTKTTSAPVTLPDMHFHWSLDRSLLLLSWLGVLFVLYHLLFRSPITAHVWIGNGFLSNPVALPDFYFY